MIKFNEPKDGAIISYNNGVIETPDKPIVPYIIGDGIGIDVTPVMKRVLNYAIGKAYGVSKEIKWMEIYAGQQALDIANNLLPDETIEAMKKYRVSIKGPLTTPIGNGFKSINVSIRQKLDLFACVRPIRYFPGTNSPMVESNMTDMVVFRENTEDLYTGIEWEPNSEGAKKTKNSFESVDFTGYVNPTIELWKLVEESKNNFVKLWIYQNPNYLEEE